ncbi:MAG: Hsp20/alpha crystallin family protein [Candidatus Xenobia bacterium]
MQQIQRTMDSMFNDLFSRVGGGSGLMALTQLPAVNMHRESDNLVVECAMPGINKDQLKITCTRDILTIQGEVKHDTKHEHQDYLHQEFRHETFSRSIPLPVDVDPNKVQAKLKDGMLRITIPQHEEARKNQVNVKID